MNFHLYARRRGFSFEACALYDAVMREEISIKEFLRQILQYGEIIRRDGDKIYVAEGRGVFIISTHFVDIQ